MKNVSSIWSKWKKVSVEIGDFQIQIIFSILYLFLILPIGLLIALFSDYFGSKKFPKWSSINGNPKTLAEMQEQ